VIGVRVATTLAGVVGDRVATAGGAVVGDRVAATGDDVLGLVVTGNAVIGIAVTGASVIFVESGDASVGVGLEVTGTVGGSALVSALAIVNDSPTTPVISSTHGAAIIFAISARTQKRTVS
jgi:hypothetical protein